jgi:hypothetical protein
MVRGYFSSVYSDDSRVRLKPQTRRATRCLFDATTLTGKNRKQTILFRGRRRWLAPQEIQNEWQCGLGVDCVEHLGLCLPACAHTAAGVLTRVRAVSHCTYYGGMYSAFPESTPSNWVACLVHSAHADVAGSPDAQQHSSHTAMNTERAVSTEQSSARNRATKTSEIRLLHRRRLGVRGGRAAAMSC